MDPAPSNRPVKKHRSESGRSATPVHQMHNAPMMYPPEHRRKPTRSESTASSHSTVGYSSPAKLVFFDDDCLASSSDSLCWPRDPCAAAPLHLQTTQNYVTSSHCIATSGQYVTGGMCAYYDLQVVDALAFDRYTPPHRVAYQGGGACCENESDHPSQELRSCSPCPEAPQRYSRYDSMSVFGSHQSTMLPASDEHQWQQSTADFFRGIDARSLRLAPHCDVVCYGGDDERE
jgi:hypothetical protein